MTDFYEFRVTGDIGPVICSAVPELTADPPEKSLIITGSVNGADEMARLLARLDELYLIETDIRIHRLAAPGEARLATENPGDTPPH